MPRYTFASWDGDRFLPDEESLEVEGLEQARALATLSLAEMARDIVPGLDGERVLRVQMRDEGGKLALELQLTFVVVADGQT